MAVKFEVGKIYTAVSYYGGKSNYIVVKRNDETQRITIQDVGFDGKPFGDKMSRKIEIVGCGYFEGEYDEGFERINVKASTRNRVCWGGGIKMDACNEVA